MRFTQMKEEKNMAKATQLLSVLARLNPAIFDVIFPHGPVHSHAFASRINEVALNPQPLPPRDRQD